MPREPLGKPGLRRLLGDPDALSEHLSGADDAMRARIDALLASYRDDKRRLKQWPSSAPDDDPAERRRRSADRKALKARIGEAEAEMLRLLDPPEAALPESDPPAPAVDLADACAAPSPCDVEIRVCPSSEAWDAYVDGHPRATGYHRWVWRDLLTDVFGHAADYLVATDAEDRIRGVLPCIRMKSRLFGHFAVSLPFVNYGGALADSAELEDALMHSAWERARSRGAERIEFRDRALREDWHRRTGKVTLELALPHSADALWRDLKPKVRAQVRKARGHAPYHFRVGGSECVSDFYDVFAENMRDLGTPVYTRRLFDAVVARIPGAEVAVLEVEGRPSSAGILLRDGGRMEIPWASTRRSANAAGANMLFYWCVLEHAIASGARCFDFGRSTRDSGTHRFKRQWGATTQDLPWHLASDGPIGPGLGPDNPRYALAIRAWQRLPVALTRLIGPPIVRNLP